MTGWVVTGVGVLAAAILGCFGARRVMLLVAALLSPRSRSEGAAELPSVLVVVPAHNEESTVGETLGAVALLDYPPERLFVVLVNDGGWPSGRPAGRDRWPSTSRGAQARRRRSTRGSSLRRRGTSSSPATPTT